MPQNTPSYETQQKRIHEVTERLEAGIKDFLSSEKYQDYEVFREGDYSPVELAWCAYVTEEQYAGVLSRYESLKNEIVKKTVDEGEHRVICYTQILTDVQGFHKDLEQYEIYNGNLNRETYCVVPFPKME